MSDSKERTLAIIKPDAFLKGYSGKIIDTIVESGLSIIGMKLHRMDKEEAGNFYKVHKGKYFYERLCDFMSSGNIIVMALEATDAISQWRTIMGSTDPQEAAEGTIRHRFGTVVTQNATHGSDCEETAQEEITFFFKESELYN